MGTLLDFASAPRPLSRVRKPSHAADGAQTALKGEVILFPGVRYERETLDLSARIGTISRTVGTGPGDQD